jgi:lysophospholipid hydrolase
MIGGTSIGSFVGGLYAMSDSYLSINRVAHKFCRQMGSVWGFVADLTFPVVSYFTGRCFNRKLFTAFGDQKIEDMWLPFYCNSTDLTTSKEIVHQNGTAWRYIRASMSLTGFLPPLTEVEYIGNAATTDSKKKVVHYLVDGGYMNSLPADHMRNVLGASTVVACDVSGDWTFDFADYGDELSGTWHYLRSYIPWLRKDTIPTMTALSGQLAYVSSVKQLEEAKALHIDLYMIPPVTKYSTLQFDLYPEIEAIGYTSAQSSVKAWRQSLLSTQQPNESVQSWLDASSLQQLKRTRSLGDMRESWM